MARRTPPIARQVIEPFISSNALFKKRLIDFDTASANLESQHTAWLQQSMGIARANSGFHIRIFGFASKLGNAKSNHTLSRNRMNSVLSFLKRFDERTLASIEVWEALGEELSTGAANDNSPEWRAVEVHIFIGEIPPTPVPPGMAPVQPALQPLPGGERFRSWAAASPGGIFIAAIAGGGVNIFYVKNEETNETRRYFQPVGGFGASLDIKGLKIIASLVQQLVTSWQFSALDFTSVKTPHAVTWDEMEGCMVRVSSAGVGLVKGAGFAVITFASSGVFQYGPSGAIIKTAEELFQFTTVGEDWQIGLSASIAAGPLFRFR